MIRYKLCYATKEVIDLLKKESSSLEQSIAFYLARRVLLIEKHLLASNQLPILKVLHRLLHSRLEEGRRFFCDTNICLALNISIDEFSFYLLNSYDELINDSIELSDDPDPNSSIFNDFSNLLNEIDGFVIVQVDSSFLKCCNFLADGLEDKPFKNPSNSINYLPFHSVFPRFNVRSEEQCDDPTHLNLSSMQLFGSPYNPMVKTTSGCLPVTNPCQSIHCPQYEAAFKFHRSENMSSVSRMGIEKSMPSLGKLHYFMVSPEYIWAALFFGSWPNPKDYVIYQGVDCTTDPLKLLLQSVEKEALSQSNRLSSEKMNLKRKNHPCTEENFDNRLVRDQIASRWYRAGLGKRWCDLLTINLDKDIFESCVESQSSTDLSYESLRALFWKERFYKALSHLLLLEQWCTARDDDQYIEKIRCIKWTDSRQSLTSTNVNSIVPQPSGRKVPEARNSKKSQVNSPSAKFLFLIEKDLQCDEGKGSFVPIPMGNEHTLFINTGELADICASVFLPQKKENFRYFDDVLSDESNVMSIDDPLLESGLLSLFRPIVEEYLSLHHEPIGFTPNFTPEDKTLSLKKIWPHDGSVTSHSHHDDAQRISPKNTKTCEQFHKYLFNTLVGRLPESIPSHFSRIPNVLYNQLVSFTLSPFQRKNNASSDSLHIASSYVDICLNHWFSLSLLSYFLASSDGDSTRRDLNSLAAVDGHNDSSGLGPNICNKTVDLSQTSCKVESHEGLCMKKTIFPSIHSSHVIYLESCIRLLDIAISSFEKSVMLRMKEFVSENIPIANLA